jgi:NAD(P)-dependent dehydrogenase (short-subunit alcohol dehydrogenase family)
MADDIPPQKQEEPGKESQMSPKPKSENPNYKPSGKFDGKVALVTGGDSGIGKSVAIHFALEGADVSIIYNESDDDANTTKERIEELGRKCLLIKGDVGDKSFCEKAVELTVNELGQLDVLINNAGEQHPQQNVEDISEDQLKRTFQTNIFSVFFMTQAAMSHLKEGSSIINNSSVTA